MTRWRCLVMAGLAAWVVTAPGSRALGAVPAAENEVWVASPVMYPVQPGTLSPAVFFAGDPATVRGPVELGPGRAAALWLDTLRVARVRVVPAADKSGDAAGSEDVATSGSTALRFGRVVGADRVGDLRAIVEEHGAFVAPGTWYLAQPPGGGAVWFVEAEAPVTVHIEVFARPRGQLVWESARPSLLAWIDRDESGAPPLPPADGAAEVRARLLAQRAVALAMAEAFPGATGLHEAARAWRKAAALQAVALLSPIMEPSYRVRALEAGLAGIGAPIQLSAGRPYRRLDSTGGDDVAGGTSRWDIELDGPGLLRVESRALFGPNPTAVPDTSQRAADEAVTAAEVREPVVMEVTAAGRRLGAVAMQPYPIMTRRTHDDPDEDEPANPADPHQPGDVGPAGRTEVTLATGEQMGSRQVLTVPLLPGRQRYTLTVRGGPLALRVTAGRYRPWAGDFRAAKAHEGDFAAAARRALDGTTGTGGPGTRLMEMLLAAIDGQPPESSQNTAPPLPPLLAAVHAVESARWRPDTAQSAVATVLAGLDRAPAEVAWHLRVELGRILVHAGAPDQVRALLDSARDTPPPDLWAAVAELLPPPGVMEEDRSRAVSLMDLAWRTAPTDASLRRRYRALWRERSAWSRLPPALTDEGSLVRESQTWLMRDDQAVGDDNAWGRVPRDRTVRIVAPPAQSDPARPALLRLAVATPDSNPGPVTVHLDGHAFTAMPVHPLENWVFAVAPGDHELAFAGPEDTEIFSSLPARDPAELTGAARLERAWPLEIGKRRVRYELPAAHLGGPIRVKLRSELLTSASRSSVVRMVFDVGPAQRIRVYWGDADPDTITVDGARRLSHTTSIVVWPPAGAGAVWFETGQGSPVVATVAVRRPRADARASGVDPSAPETAPAGPLDRITSLSRHIDDQRPDPALLVERAHLLIDLGFPGLARRDVYRLMGRLRGPRGQGDDPTRSPAALRELISRLDVLREPDHLPAASPAGAAATPVPLYPAELALPGTAAAAARAAVIEARAGNRQRALALLQGAAEPRARYLRARLLFDSGAGAEAARALLVLASELDARPEHQWQLAMEACTIFRSVLESGAAMDRGVAALAYGAARALDALGSLPNVRQTLILSSALSRWTVIRNAEAAAGYERIVVEPSPERRSPRLQLQEALIAAPWPAGSAHPVSPGKAAALKVDLLQPAVLSADVWCRRLHVAPPGDKSRCRIIVRIDGQTAFADDVPSRQVVTVLSPELPAGAHHLEVTLAADSKPYRASVRFASDRPMPHSLDAVVRDSGEAYPVRIRRPGTALVATPDAPVEVVVLGPGALLVEARRRTNQPGATLQIDLTAASGAHAARHLVLDPAPDTSAARREGTQVIRDLTTAAALVMPLPERGAYRVTLRPDAGSVALRLALREDRAHPLARTRLLWQPSLGPDSELVRWPGAPEELALLGGVPRQPPARGSTLSVALSARSTDLTDLDDAPTTSRLDLDLGWRRRVDLDLGERGLGSYPIWTHLGALLRQRLDGGLVAGSLVRVHARGLPLGLRASYRNAGFVQWPDAGAAWSLQNRLELERPLMLGPDLTMTPELFVHAHLFSLGEAGAHEPDPAVDPDVYTAHGFWHRRGLTPGLGFRWTPFQDQAGRAAVRAVTNRDLMSLDRVEASLGWSAATQLGRGIGVAHAGYRLSYRFADPDRPESFWRHDLSGQLEWTLWTGRLGRILVHGRATAYLVPSRARGLLPLPADSRLSFAAGIGYDLTSGRGFFDMMPFEEEFDSIVERRLYAVEDLP